MSKKYFVSGIGTEVGKTIVSAILVEALKADYWKPVQAGDLDWSDSMKIQNWVSNERTFIHPEGVKLNSPMSPHAAAAIDGIRLNLSDFELPKTDNNLIVEGAGGLLVPLNEKDCIIDLIKYLNLEILLVSRHYLGSINHTLLSCEILKHRNIPIKGIIFNGDEHKSTETVIEKMTGLPILGRIPKLSEVNKNTISLEALEFQKIL